jgi:large subunit ribosomal protein L4e
MPLVVGGDVEGLEKTKAILNLLEAVGCDADVDKVKASKKLRAGKGKMRNRRYTMRRGPLIVFDNGDKIEKAARNIPGVETVCVERLNLLQLAPGGHMGRLCIWTQAAFDKLDKVFGDGTSAAELKKGYVLPQAQMTNSDLARIINSDEVQSKLNAPKESKFTKKVKVNPLKNWKVMESLNPHVRDMRKLEQAAQDARKADKAKRLAKARANTKNKEASKAFFAVASKEGDVVF